MTRATRILFVGDSVTAGFGLAGAPTYAQLAADRLRDRGLAVDVSYDALDGIDSRYLLRRFDRMITAHDPDWVVVAVGLNDAHSPSGRAPASVAEFAENIVEIVDRIWSLDARPLVVVENPRFDRGPGDCFAPYAAALRETAAALGVPLVDAHAAFVAERDLEAIVPDGVHPNARGHELLADLVTEELLSLLPSGAKIQNERRMSKSE